MLACASFDRLRWLATNSSLFKFHRNFFSTCESLRVVWTQNTSRCKSFLPERALELVEVSELYIQETLYIGDSIYRVHWRKFRTCDDLCRRLTGGIESHRKTYLVRWLTFTFDQGFKPLKMKISVKSTNFQKLKNYNLQTFLNHVRRILSAGTVPKDFLFFAISRVRSAW